jgi:hypothetical protein
MPQPDAATKNNPPAAPTHLFLNPRRKPDQALAHRIPFTPNNLILMWIQQNPSSPAPLADLQGRAVGLKFECEQCHTEVFTDLIGVPAPNDQADSPEHAENHEIEEIKCPGCDMTHTLEVDSTFDGVTFKVSEAKEVSYQVAE